MSEAPESLSEDDIRQIALLAEMFDRSEFDAMQIDAGGLKVRLSKSGAPPDSVATPVPAPEARTPAAEPEPGGPSQAPEDGTVAIVAPTLGRFYAKPEPQAAPFVTLGSVVQADTTVALVEVMKVFTAVRSGVAGTIVDLCVQDADLIEYGQALFRVRPAA